MDLDVALAFELNALIDEPLSVEVLEVLPCTFWGVISCCVFQWRKFFLSDCFEEAYLIGFLEDIEVEELKLYSIIFLGSHNFP